MTKAKFPGQNAPIVVRPQSIEVQFIEHLKSQVERLQKDVDWYRGKCERLELSIMNSETQGEARVEFVERTDIPDAAPSIRNATVPTPPSSRAGVHKTKFQVLQEKWDKLTPAEQAAATGEPVPEPQPKVV